MATGRISNRKDKNGKKTDAWEITINFGYEGDKRQRKQITFRGRKQDAQAEMARLLTEYNNPNVIKYSSDPLEKWLNDWLAGREKNLTESTRIKYNYYIEYIVPILGNIGLKDITPSDVDRLKIERLKTLAPKTVHGMLTFLSQAFNRAVSLKKIPSNPCHGVEKPRITSKARALELPELLRLLGEAKGTYISVLSSKGKKKVSIYPLIFLIANTGMRISEALGLTWDNVDMDELIIKVRRQRRYGKKGELKTDASERDIGVSKEVIEALKTVPKNGEFLFPMAESTINRHFFKICVKADINNFTVHDLRHTHASLLLAAGEPLTNVSQRLGHANPSITARIYAHFIPSELHSAAETFATLLKKRATKRQRPARKVLVVLKKH